MDSTQERSASFRCFDNFLNPENWETYRLPADVTSFEDESLAGDDDDLTSEVQEKMLKNKVVAMCLLFRILS